MNDLVSSRSKIANFINPIFLRRLIQGLHIPRQIFERLLCRFGIDSKYGEKYIFLFQGHTPTCCDDINYRLSDSMFLWALILFPFTHFSQYFRYFSLQILKLLCQIFQSGRGRSECVFTTLLIVIFKRLYIFIQISIFIGILAPCTKSPVTKTLLHISTGSLMFLKNFHLINDFFPLDDCGFNLLKM